MQRRRFLNTLAVGSLAAATPFSPITPITPAVAAGPAEVDDGALAGASFGALSTWRGATPALALQDLLGQPRQLSEWRGRVVLINFWATWCGPCRSEMPAMSAVARQYAARGLTLLAVNVKESLATIKPFLAKVPVDGTILLDRDGDAVKRWGAIGLPTTYLVDRNGNARFWKLGELDWRDAGLHGHIEALLASTPADGTSA
ncbi:Thiol-disulfide oxidoreductase ResA [Pandoraea terrae]|uniref:Thiol-disulfide oxidoreductase ResA n=1 Tax=Pandoraea terrae TaxID=1537710 RepID=A0A5E4UI74_9BURK|nr:TlpA disulfide reductase family protein [Pandoraea terrae]VVD99746.1 Thiol-disulfide oxidoreductase ResA [Pandoraea terrae]